MTELSLTKSEIIASLNDNLRQSFRGGRVLFTEGVQDLSVEERSHLLIAVRNHNTFEPENDPYGERDFGAVEVNGQKYFFKIDYYDLDLEKGSEDPADPSITTRVMTLMMASEY